MNAPAWALGEPVTDQSGVVARRIVEFGRNIALDTVEELAELMCTMAPHALADDGSGLDVQCCEERTDMYRQLARIVVKIFRGAKPADMPVGQPSRFQLVINLKAAKALAHEVPAGLVLRADEVIE